MRAGDGRYAGYLSRDRSDAQFVAEAFSPLASSRCATGDHEHAEVCAGAITVSCSFVVAHGDGRRLNRGEEPSSSSPVLLHIEASAASGVRLVPTAAGVASLDWTFFARSGLCDVLPPGK